MFVGGTFAGFADMFSQLQKTLGATQSVREILRSDGEPVDLKQIIVEPQYILKGNVRFEHVAFSYPSRKDIQVLKDLITYCKQWRTDRYRRTKWCRQINYCFTAASFL